MPFILRLFAVFVAAMQLSSCQGSRASSYDDGGQYYRIHIDRSLIGRLRLAKQGVDDGIPTGNTSIDVNGTVRVGSEHSAAVIHGGRGGFDLSGSFGNGSFAGGGGGDGRVFVIIVAVVAIVVVVIIVAACASTISGKIYRFCTFHSSNHYSLELAGGELPSQILHIRNGKHTWLIPPVIQAINARTFKYVTLRHGNDLTTIPVLVSVVKDVVCIDPWPAARIVPQRQPY
jgi:hypothetical protein